MIFRKKQEKCFFCEDENVIVKRIPIMVLYDIDHGIGMRFSICNVCWNQTHRTIDGWDIDLRQKKNEIDDVLDNLTKAK